jgi:hypothetical protein
VGEEEIDLSALNAELVEIETTIQTATAKHNEFLKELGIPLLPIGTALAATGFLDLLTPLTTDHRTCTTPTGPGPP